IDLQGLNVSGFVAILSVKVSYRFGRDTGGGADAITAFLADVFAEIEVDDLLSRGTALKVYLRKLGDLFEQISLTIKFYCPCANFLHLEIIRIGHFRPVNRGMPFPANPIVVFQASEIHG